jgi:hypothetical protein
MWWVAEDHRPTAQEALAKLELLRRHGASEQAFGWESLPHLKAWMQQRCA